jgi:transposase
MRAYSMDLRLRVLRDSEEGLESEEIAEKYGVSRSWIDRVKQRKREFGEIEPRRGSGRKSLLKPHFGRLQQLLEQRPDITLKEIRDELQLTVSLQAIWKVLNQLGYTFKKNP